MADLLSSRHQTEWKFSECCLMLNACLKQKIKQSSTPERASNLKRAVMNNDYEQVVQLLKLKDGGRHRINKLLTFQTNGCVLHLPLLCVAIVHRNLHIICCLLSNGADPNKLGQMCVHSCYRNSTKWARMSPLLLALEDHPVEGFSFDPVVASALLEAGGDLNTQAASTVREEEEEGGCIDFDTSHTPLHRCTDFMHPQSTTVFHFLLDNGADMFIKDSHRRTPLQKALAFLADSPELECEMSDFADELIRRGGFIHSPSEKYDKSDFQLLLNSLELAVSLNHSTVKILERICLLLDAGYQCSKSDVARFEESEISSHFHSLGEWVRPGRCIYSLKHLCRLVIRTSVGSNCSRAKLSLLPLPTCLVKYVFLEQ